MIIFFQFSSFRVWINACYWSKKKKKKGNSFVVFIKFCRSVLRIDTDLQVELTSLHMLKKSGKLLGTSYQLNLYLNWALFPHLAVLALLSIAQTGLCAVPSGFCRASASILANIIMREKEGHNVD